MVSGKGREMIPLSSLGKVAGGCLNNHVFLFPGFLPCSAKKLSPAPRGGFAALSPCIVCVARVTQGGRFPLPRGWKQDN